MRCFPVPNQKLLLEQLNVMHKRIWAGNASRTLSEMNCSCGFSKKFLLGCKLIFHIDYFFQTLTSEDWTAWAEIVEEGG